MVPTVTSNTSSNFQTLLTFYVNFLNNKWINNTLLNFMYIKGYNPAFEVVCVAQRINKKKRSD